jgi:MFS family permease
MMTGIVKVGTGAGQLLVPLVATTLVTLYGWRNAYLIIGSLTLLILVAVAQVLRRDPQTIGQLPDGGADEPCGSKVVCEEQNVSLRTAVRTMQFWTICVVEFVILFCLLTMIVHIVPHATDLGLPPATAAGVLATIGGVSMLGRIVMGTANDRIGGKRSLIISLIVLICGLVWLQISGKAWMLFLFAVIYGIAHGGFFTVMSPTIAEFFGTGSHGLLYGIVLFSGAIGGAVGPLLGGYIFDKTASYQVLFVVLTALAAVGFVLIALLKPLRDIAAPQ